MAPSLAETFPSYNPYVIAASRSPVRPTRRRGPMTTHEDSIEAQDRPVPDAVADLAAVAIERRVAWIGTGNSPAVY